MLPQRYEYARSRDFRQYEFYSEGPKGRIRKIVFYSYLETEDGYTYYNLGFGDYDPRLKRINDLAVSDNKDRDMVLATVVATALEFTKHFPNSVIVIKGSTAARTRLYQMKIAANFPLIIERFDIQCLTNDGRLVPFKSGENFESFVLKRKL